MLPLLAWACLVGPCASPAPAGFVPRRHSLTVMAPNDGAAAFNSTFGTGNWKALSPYVDLLVAPRKPDVPADMKAARYFDPNRCSGEAEPGANHYALPDCSGWPAGAFYTQPGYSDRVLTTKSSGIRQRFADPASSLMRTLSLDSILRALSERDDDLVYLDDAWPPESYYAEMCWGTPSFAAGSAPCADAPGGAAHAPFGGGPQAWVGGMRTLIDAIPRPVVLNSDVASDAAHVPSPVTRLIAEDRNIWGVACDGCFYGNAPTPKNRFLWSGSLFRARLDGLMDVAGAGKNVVMIDFAVTDPAERARALADIMLLYAADRTWFWYAVCGARSHIHVCPEAALTFYRPVRPYPKDTRDIEAPGGAFDREFGACYEAGKSVGPCAAVVNPDPNATLPLPELRHTYSHTLRMMGSSLCVCYGDSGALHFDGPAPPRGLPPASGYVLFP